MNLADEADQRAAVQKLAQRIEKLSEGPIAASATAYTGRFDGQLTTFVQFVNGVRRKEWNGRDPEDEKPGPWRGRPAALLDATFDAVEEYALSVPSPRVLTWRIYPEVQIERGGPRLYLRLAFETARIPAEAFEPSAPAPLPPPALVATITEPNMELVHLIEGLLARAMEGDLRALAYVTVSKGATVGTGWFHGLPGENHRHNIGSGAAILAHRIAADSAGPLGYPP